MFTKLLNLIIVLILSSNLVKLKGDMSICSYENNIDYYSSVDILYVIARTPDSCCQLCSFKPGCVGYSFTTRTNTCFLKSSILLASRKVTPGRSSGILVQVNQSLVFTSLLKTLQPEPLIATTNIVNVNTTTASPIVKCTSYSSINFEGSDLAQSYVENPEKCCETCSKTPLCKTWTFLSDGNYCMLKSSIPMPNQIHSTSNTISGVFLK